MDEYQDSMLVHKEKCFNQTREIRSIETAGFENRGDQNGVFPQNSEKMKIPIKVENPKKSASTDMRDRSSHGVCKL